MTLVLLWVGSLSEWLNLWDELASWAVAGLLVPPLIVATMPRLDAVRDLILGPSRPAIRAHRDPRDAASHRARRERAVQH